MKKFLIVCCLLFVVNLSALPIPHKPYVMDYDKKTLCLVRKLPIYKNPKWASKITLQNGKNLYFSSPKSMFEFYHQPGKWFDIGVKKESDFKDIVVTDYETMKPIDAKKAFFVYGSRAISPSGDDLVSFESKDAASKFASQYSGKRVFKFDEVKPSLIKLINGNI